MTAYEIGSLDLKSSLPMIRYEDNLTKPFRLKQVCEGVQKQLQTTQ